jgi:histidyl-tRNA synthetase
VLDRAPALAAGGRYDGLANSLGSKKDVPSVGASIGVDRVLSCKEYQFLTPKILKKPKVYFIQLGYEAKLKSLSVIEILRKTKVATAHALNKDKLSAQLGMAEKLKIPYAIILGQKEALDGTVIVRNMGTRSQDTVKIEQLPEYIKKHM